MTDADFRSAKIGVRRPATRPDGDDAGDPEGGDGEGGGGQ